MVFDIMEDPEARTPIDVSGNFLLQTFQNKLQDLLRRIYASYEEEKTYLQIPPINTIPSINATSPAVNAIIY